MVQVVTTRLSTHGKKFQFPPALCHQSSVTKTFPSVSEKEKTKMLLLLFVDVIDFFSIFVLISCLIVVFVFVVVVVVEVVVVIVIVVTIVFVIVVVHPLHGQFCFQLNYITLWETRRFFCVESGIDSEALYFE